MLPILNIGPVAIQTPGLIILLGIYLVFIVIEKYAPKFNLSANVVTNILFWSLMSAILFSRLAYVIEYPASFMENPLAIISLNLSLFDPVSGFILAILLMFILIRKKDLPIISVMDNFAVGLTVFISFYFISLFASGNYYGIPTKLPWGIYLWGTIRHPLQLYFLIGSLIINFIIFNQIKQDIRPGKIFFMFIALQSIEFIFLDFFRGDNKLMLGNVHLTQVIGLGFLIASLIFFIKPAKKLNDKTEMAFQNRISE